MNEEVNNDLEQFLLNGFASPSKHLLWKLRIRDINYKICDCSGGSKGGNSFSCFELFGRQSHRYYFIIEEKEKLVEHLLAVFRACNPNPTDRRKRAFNIMLHNNSLIKRNESIFKKK